MKYLILGQQGWLAQKFNNFLGDSENSMVDILDLPALKKEIDDKKPAVVINAAGITGRPNIDWCEEHKAETIAGNVTVPLNILQACSEWNIYPHTKRGEGVFDAKIGEVTPRSGVGVYWVHLGSGCIFQGEGPDGKGFSEDDDNKAHPPSFYSWTKYWADQILKNFPVLIVRLRLPIDIEPNPRNLIDKLIKYPQVIDSKNSITVIPDFLEAAKKLIEKRCTGVYHVVNPGVITPSEIMELYQKIIDPTHQFKTISEEQIYSQGLAKAKRSNCFLNTEKLQREGIYLKPIKERIGEVMDEYKKNLSL